MNKIIKSTLIIMITLLLLFSIPLYSVAEDSLTFEEIIRRGDSFLENEEGEGITITPSEGGMKKISNIVSNILLTIALGVTLISAIVMGINFVAQSVEDKAKIKESMVPWIIGIFVSFGAYGIWRITMDIFYQL